jgi:hypothetical protein
VFNAGISEANSAAFWELRTGDENVTSKQLVLLLSRTAFSCVVTLQRRH